MLLVIGNFIHWKPRFVMVLLTFLSLEAPERCHNDSPKGRQWRQSWHHDNSRFSVISRYDGHDCLYFEIDPIPVDCPIVWGIRGCRPCYHCQWQLKGSLLDDLHVSVISTQVIIHDWHMKYFPIIMHTVPSHCTRINLLTLYVLNFSEVTKTYIYILCHSSTLTWHRLLKSFLK